jgi:hypothetical protein
MSCLCLECFDVYEDEAMFKTKYDYDTEMYCPKKSCKGIVIEVDELLLLPIKILNQKGYITKYCCSGHIYSSYPQTYIVFEDDINLPNIPNGFYVDAERCIRKDFNYKKNNELLLQKEIIKTVIDILSWVKKLPKLEEE